MAVPLTFDRATEPVHEAAAEADPAERARGLAWKALNRRDRTVDEIGGMLLGKRVEPAVADQVVCELIELGYLDDARYAERFADDRRRLDAWGSERIARRLRELGVDREHIDAALAAQDPEEEMAAALELLRRRCPAPPATRAERDRALGILVRRGYSHGSPSTPCAGTPGWRQSPTTSDARPAPARPPRRPVRRPRPLAGPTGVSPSMPPLTFIGAPDARSSIIPAVENDAALIALVEELDYGRARRAASAARRELAARGGVEAAPRLARRRTPRPGSRPPGSCTCCPTSDTCPRSCRSSRTPSPTSRAPRGARCEANAARRSGARRRQDRARGARNGGPTRRIG